MENGEWRMEIIIDEYLKKYIQITGKNYGQ